MGFNPIGVVERVNLRILMVYVEIIVIEPIIDYSRSFWGLKVKFGIY
jgi:hypothetical protein